MAEVLDDTPLGLPLPHPENDPHNTDVPRIRAALAMLDGFISGLQADKVDADQVSALITAAINALKGDVPEAFDTLVEIASKLSDNDDAVAALVAQIAQKADAAAVNAALAAINATLGEKADAATVANGLTSLRAELREEAKRLALMT